MTLSELRSCTRCGLATTRTQVVVGSLPAGARLLVVGEAPGAAEDLAGEPFVGRSGQLLDRLLSSAGLPRSSVAVLNTVKCRPPGNRAPSRTETAACRTWLDEQLLSLHPALVVALGLSATRWFLGPVTLSDVRGQVHVVDGRRVLPTYHPAAALRGGPAGTAMTSLQQDLALAVELVA